MKKFKLLLLFLIMLFTLSGCDFIKSLVDDSIGDIDDEIKTEYVTVTFNGENPQTIEKGKQASKIEAPVKEGYTFVYWMLDDKAFDFSGQVNEDINLTPYYTKNIYTVTFNNNDQKTEETVEYGSKVTKPSDPIIEGKEFLGWYLDNKLFDFDTQIKDNINLIAKYSDIKFKVTFDVDGSTYKTSEVKYNGKAAKPTEPTKEGFTFKYWMLNDTEYDFNTAVLDNITLIAYFEAKKFTVTFMADNKVYYEAKVENDSVVTKPTNPTKDNNTFVCWKKGEYKFDFNTKINGNITLVAEFVSSSSIVLEYDFGYDCYETKSDLRFAFYSDFYDFLLSRNVEMSQYEIKNIYDFLKFMDTWTYGGRSEMGYIGVAFGRYYLTKGSLESQPETTFLGWCYKNNKYIDFIHHLEVFFEYWRVDEGYATDTNHGKEFYYDAWAAMVDTAKFFHFTSDNLQETYGWFDSERVHYALDHIPGVGRVTLTYTSESEITLPQDITRDGYTFIGWYDENGSKITKAVKSMKVTARWDDNRLEELAEEFLSDFNKVTGKNLESIDKLDTANFDSLLMETFGSNQEMITKWMWLYKAIADLNENEKAYPDANGFSWADYKGFYLANLCGLFTRTKHTDKYLKNVSADYSDYDNVLAVIDYDKIKVTFIVDGQVYKVSMIEKGAKITKPTNPTKEGYTFVNWKNGTEEFSFNTVINSELTLTASFDIKKFKVDFKVDGAVVHTDNVNYNEKATSFTAADKTGYKFVSWMNGDNSFDFNTKITSDLTLVAKYEINTYTVTFKVDNSTYATKTVKYNETVVMPNNPTKNGFTFVGWKNGTNDFDSSTKITTDLTLTAKFEASSNINVSYNFGYTCYQTKEDLRVAYYTDFYNFMVSKNANFSKYNINNVNDFLVAMDTWKFNGTNEMGGIGNAFGSYYLVKDTENKLENQPETTFLGWCYKNNKYIDFIHHLETFFAYWRTDEGYTTATNHGNEFYYDSWAAMVDTAKFFHFTSANLQKTYSWFDSERVHYALDHIPGVGRVTLTYTSESEITLPQDITRDGYEFKGWVDSNSNPITKVSSSMTVYATWEERDRLEEIGLEFLADFNKVNGKNYDSVEKLDTSKLESSYMVTFGNNQEMTAKWMWLYKAIANLNENPKAYPDDSDFNWTNYKGFYLANLCGLFTRTKHQDTYLHDVSADYSDPGAVDAVLNSNKIIVRFNIGDNTYKIIPVESGTKVTAPENPTLEGYDFVCWKKDGQVFDFNTVITEKITLTAYFEEIQTGVNVRYDFSYTCYQTKNDLKVAYYTDFYNFLISQNYEDWEDYEISNLDDFLVFMDTFKWKDRSEMGTIGTAFGSYYVSKDIGGVLENQPETVFLGWCYKNNKYIDFIHHLETFFAYWRTDEGYSKNDPNGNDFYASSWASMVDTAKFFYFNGDTLNTNFNGIYSWFDSDRVDYALDHIPGVGRVTLQYNDETQITLPTDITRVGYTFTGWKDANNNPVTVATSSMTVYATWEKAETIVYTIRAEATTNGVSGSETNWYCAVPSQTNYSYLYGIRIILVQDGTNYKVSQLLDKSEAIDGTYAYRIVNYYDGDYHTFDEAIKVGQKVKATVDGNYIIFNFYA